ncbi:uncharacterized protein Y057_5648 [Fusarium fujikuroi]|nr:uncharacterized protein Y057_5648 [Fusarium fujikuroi]
MALYSSSSLTFPYPTTIRHPLQIPIRATITDARCHHGSPQVSSKTPIQVSDNPDYSTNDTGVSDLSPTTGLVADGPQPTKTQAPVSDDIDASPRRVSVMIAAPSLRGRPSRQLPPSLSQTLQLTLSNPSPMRCETTLASYFTAAEFPGRL